MKLNSGFIAHNDGEDKLLVSTGATKFSGLVRSNSTAGFIIECLETETTEDAENVAIGFNSDLINAVSAFNEFEELYGNNLLGFNESEYIIYFVTHSNSLRNIEILEVGFKEPYLTYFIHNV